MLRESLCSLKGSERFEAVIKRASTLAEGVESYKAMVLKTLGATTRRNQLQHKLIEEKDDALFSKLLPEPSPPADQPDPSRKRTASQVDETLQLGTIPKKKKSAIPALASLNFLSSSDDDARRVKKSVLVTRQRLTQRGCSTWSILQLMPWSERRSWSYSKAQVCCRNVRGYLLFPTN